MANYRFKTAEIEAMKKNILTQIKREAETKTAWRLRCAIEGQLMCCRPSKREAARLERELALYEKLTKNDLPNWQSEPTQPATPAETPRIVRVEIVRDFDKSYYANLYGENGGCHNLSKEYTDFRTLKTLCKKEYGVNLPNLSQIEFETHGRKSYAYISTETPQISTETAEAVNVSVEGEKAENEPQKHISEVLKEAEQNYQCVKSETLHTVRETDGKWHTYFMGDEIGVDLAYDQINHIPAARTAQAAEEVAEIRRYINRLNGNHIADADYYLAEMREGIKQAEVARRKKNADTEGENAAEPRETTLSSREQVLAHLDKLHGLEYDAGEVVYFMDGCTAEEQEGGTVWRVYPDTESGDVLEMLRIAPQSPETPQVIEYAGEYCQLARTA